jgi:hypothetical protein
MFTASRPSRSKRRLLPAGRSASDMSTFTPISWPPIFSVFSARRCMDVIVPVWLPEGSTVIISLAEAPSLNVIGTSKVLFLITSVNR